ncbi:MAG: hypothetical protein PSX80_01015 [bacterium]|nr:hypothetical protein [bacterium]
MAICVVVVSLCTVAFAIWYSRIYDEWACTQRGGKWFQVRNTCIEE